MGGRRSGIGRSRCQVRELGAGAAPPADLVRENVDLRAKMAILEDQFGDGSDAAARAKVLESVLAVLRFVELSISHDGC